MFWKNVISVIHTQACGLLYTGGSSRGCHLLIQAHTHTDTQAHTLAHRHMYMHTGTHMYMGTHTHTHLYTHTHTRTHMHVFIHTWVHAHTHRHTHMGTWHTHIHYLIENITYREGPGQQYPHTVSGRGSGACSSLLPKALDSCFGGPTFDLA
jgi:hypothetical protein